VAILSLEERLSRVWWDGARPAWWQYALSPVYRALSSIQQAWQRSRARHPGVPVVVVGNLAVGGSGKTPVVLAIIKWLRQQGWQPGIVSRGYGARIPTPRLVNKDDRATAVGDEPLMMKQRAPQTPIAVGPERYQAALLLKEHGVDIIVSDDGLQHHRMARDIEICVVDGERQHGNQKLLPLGPLREPLSRLTEFDLVVQNGGDELAADWLHMGLLGESLCSLSSNRRKEVASFASQPIDAIAGIGNPDRFFRQLEAQGCNVTRHAFADHQAFNSAQLEPFRGKPLIMTEKDAVKCRSYAAEQDWWYWPVSAQLPDAFFQRLRQLLQNGSQESNA